MQISSDGSKTDHVLAKKLELPCGTILKNRLVKSAMSDSLGNGQGDSTEQQARLYERWAEGGVALALIGETQVIPDFPEKPGNLVLSDNSDQKALRSLIQRATVNGMQLWPQLGHAGALAHAPISLPKGPSALDLPALKCGELSSEEIQALPHLYANAALLAKQVGFNGLQIHAGHGFLLSQFLSPLFNRRKDGYGGSIEARSRIILEIIHTVRQAVGSSFPIGIRINATDKLEGGLTEQDALEVIRLLDTTSIDLIDISGGTYFPDAKSSSDSSAKDAPYFRHFSQQAKRITNIPIMLTGGFTKCEQAIDILETGDADMVSLARALVLNPNLPNLWLDGMNENPDFPIFQSPPKGGITAWYSMRLTALAEDTEDKFSLDLETALQVYEARDAKRCIQWKEHFKY